MIKINGYTYVPGVEYTGKNVFMAATVKSLSIILKGLWGFQNKLG